MSTIMCPIDRGEALSLIRENVKNQDMVKHMLAVEAIMNSLGEYYGDDVNLWRLTRILHDIDYELAEGDMTRHGLLAEKKLSGRVDARIIRAVMVHNYENTCIAPESRMEKMLICADAVSGPVIACALVMPSKKLNEVSVQTITKFKDKDFARGSDRAGIVICESVGLKKDRLFEISPKSLQSIGGELGL